MATSPPPLEGLKVLEFAGLAPGPFAGLLLADAGASVIRVDRPSSSPSPDQLTRRKASVAIDLRGFLGLDEQVRAGFQSIDLRVRLTGPESTQDYHRLEEAVAAHCPVADNLTAGVPVRTRVTVAA